MCMKKRETPNKNTPPFKVGDKVKILPRNGFQEDYYPKYVDGMLKYAGRLATITLVMETSYKIDLDDSKYYWPFEALQLVISEIDEPVDPHNLKNGDYIKIINTSTDIPFIYLFREVKNNIIYKHAAYSLMDKNIYVYPDNNWLVNSTTKITYATKEEKQLLDKALLEQGYIWNNSTKQLDSIGVVDVSLANTYLNDFSVPSVDVSSFQNFIQRINTVTNLLSDTKEKSQTETELNMFPTKKHCQLNFNY